MQIPKVSVLMTSYNREAYIAEAIESVLASNFKDFELIVLDDCSSDKTVQIANAYAENDSRVKVFENEHNIGQFANRNKIASLANANLLKYVDSDDSIEQWGLSYCVEAMENFPDAGIGIYYSGKGSKEKLSFLKSEQSIYIHFFKEDILSIGPSGTIIRRQAFQNIGGFDSRFGVASDNHFNILMASKYPVVLLPKLFLFYREHLEQEKNNPKGYLINNYNLLKELFDSKILPLSKTQLNFQKRKLDKRFSINLMKMFLKNYSLADFKQVTESTGFNFVKFSKGLTY